MAVITHDRVRRTPRFHPALVAIAGILVAAPKRAVAPHKTALRNLYDVPLTVVATGCIDYAGFHLGGGWGWLITGISLIALEHVIADDQ